MLRLIDLVADCAAEAAAVPAVLVVGVAAVPDAGRGLIHPYQLYFPCSGGRDSEARCCFLNLSRDVLQWVVVDIPISMGNAVIL